MSTTDYLLTIAEVSRRIGFQKSTIYARVSAGTFPKPRKLGSHPAAPIRWLSSEITEWMTNLPTAEIRSSASTDQQI
jgi:prophage regulatory protein